MISNIIFYNKLPSYAFPTSEKINSPSGTRTQELPFRGKPLNHCAIGLFPLRVKKVKTRYLGYEVFHNTNILIYEYAFNICLNSF